MCRKMDGDPTVILCDWALPGEKLVAQVTKERKSASDPERGFFVSDEIELLLTV